MAPGEQKHDESECHSISKRAPEPPVKLTLWRCAGAARRAVRQSRPKGGRKSLPKGGACRQERVFFGDKTGWVKLQGGQKLQSGMTRVNEKKAKWRFNRLNLKGRCAGAARRAVRQSRPKGGAARRAVR